MLIIFLFKIFVCFDETKLQTEEMFLVVDKNYWDDNEIQKISKFIKNIEKDEINRNLKFYY